MENIPEYSSKNFNETFLHLLICPNCEGELRETSDRLKCLSCNRSYEIRDGIPLLYPDTLNREHLEEEENLAGMMLEHSHSQSPKDQFNAKQWKASKQEFYDIVKSRLAPPPLTMVNLGCGYDSSFRHFERAGYTFVNFDMIYHMPHHLKTKHGAKMCVVGDIKAPPLRRNSFDYVICIDVIHHECDQLVALFNIFKKLLKPGGTLFLSDPHAWGMFQMVKSILLPRPLYRIARSTYHKVKKSTCRPSDYEFATNYWTTKQILASLGFVNLKIYPNYAYPNISETSYKIYSLLKSDWIRKYHNYHYVISAERT
jgi:uncharacterized protein YbaR (Trm112 family)